VNNVEVDVSTRKNMSWAELKFEVWSHFFLYDALYIIGIILALGWMYDNLLVSSKKTELQLRGIKIDLKSLTDALDMIEVCERCKGAFFEEKIHGNEDMKEWYCYRCIEEE
jgi:hypothetical protein